MSRHHNTYKDRPGMMGTSGHLAAIEGNSGLRARQERRIRNTCTIGEDHNRHECNGSPFPSAYDVSVSDDDE